MGLRVKLDGNILLNTPKGWEDASIKTKMDRTVKGLFVNYTTDLDFWGDGFDYLDAKLEDTYCQIVEIVIESNECTGEWEEEYVGVIQLTQITEYNVNERIIQTKLFDNSYDAQISNNKSLKAYVNVGISKNAEIIDSVSSHEIEFFDPTAIFPTYLPDVRNGYRVYDCFRFIIDYMSDGTVDFRSDIFSGDYYDWMLFNGKEVRLGSGDGFQLEVSFKEIFQELNKKTNLSFAIEPTESGYANPYRLRLEPTDYFEQDNALVTLDNIPEVLMSFNKQELYSNVDIGSKSFEDDVFSTSYPPLNFKAFKEENYTIAGNCNIDKTLDLVSKYIIDTNIIEDAVVNNEDRYDKKTFLIVTDGTKAVKYKEYDDPVVAGVDVGVTAFQLQDNTFPFAPVAIGDMVINMNTQETAAVLSKIGANILVLDADIFSTNDDYQVRTNPYNYNHPLTNVEVIGRFLGGIPNSVVKHIGVGGSANFKAQKTGTTFINSFPYSLSPIPYNDDSTPPNFDAGGNYDNATYKYTVPASGLYGFKALSSLRLFNFKRDIQQNGRFNQGGNNQDFWEQNTSSTYFGNVYFYNALENYWLLFGAESNSYLRQYVTINPYTHYVVRFKARWGNEVFGSTGKAPFNISCNDSYQVSVNSEGWAEYEVRLDYSASANPPSYIEFKFHGAGSQISLRDVRFEEQATFQIEQTIKRASPSGGTEQLFLDSRRLSLNNFSSQFELDILSEHTFSTFLNEEISVDLSVSILSGNPVSQGALLEETTLETVLTDDGGGGILPKDPTDSPVYRYKFEKSMSRTEFNSLRDNPEAAILFSNTNTNHIFGWRNSINWKRKSGIATFELRSKTKIKGDC